MTERYEPASDFLKAVIAEAAPLSGSDFGRANFERLLAMMHDDDRSNRDWATLLLAQQDVDTIEVRHALRCAARDKDEYVRAEAILGLAQRDRAAALPFVREALSKAAASAAIFEAAALVADPSLVGDLHDFTIPSDNDYLDKLARDALSACEHGRSVEKP